MMAATAGILACFAGSAQTASMRALSCSCLKISLDTPRILVSRTTSSNWGATSSKLTFLAGISPSRLRMMYWPPTGITLETWPSAMLNTASSIPW